MTKFCLMEESMVGWSGGEIARNYCVIIYNYNYYNNNKLFISVFELIAWSG